MFLYLLNSLYRRVSAVWCFSWCQIISNTE